MRAYERNKMLPAARVEAAIYLLGKIADERRPADDIVRAWFQARRFVGSKDRRAIRERVYGVLRRINRLDWHLGDAEANARTRVLADLVLDGEDAQSLFDGSTHGPKPLNEVEQAIATRLTGKVLDDDAMPDYARAEVPAWLAEKLKPVLGHAFLEEMAALNVPAPMDLRVALARVTRDQAQKALSKSGVKTQVTALSPLGLRTEAHTDIARTPAFRKGLVEVQDEGSQILSILVGAKASMHIVDYCAGAGGKTLAIADRMGLQGGHSAGRLVACDIDEARLARMDRRLHRARLNDLVERHVLGDAAWDSANAATFDRVLVDAPCTGSGTWRRHPEQKKRLTKDRLAELMQAQDDVLNGSTALVKPGGRLIYATCSMLAEENEDRLDAFLKAHPDFRVMPIQAVWAEIFKGDPCPDMPGDYLRLTPRQHGTDGFFVGVLERKA